MLFRRSLSNFIETPPKQHLKYFNVRSSILCSHGHLRSTYIPMTLCSQLRHQITCRPCILYLSNYLRVFAYLSPFCGGGCLFWWRCVQILERRLSARGMERWTKQTFKFRADRFTRRLGRRARRGVVHRWRYTALVIGYCDYLGTRPKKGHTVILCHKAIILL